MLERMRSRRVRPLVAGLAAALIAAPLAGCGSSPSPSDSCATTSPMPSGWLCPTPAPAETGTVRPSGPIKIRWLAEVGGVSAWSEKQAFIKAFNASQSEIVLEEVPPSMDPLGALQLMIASGDAPDIIGPFGLYYLDTLRPNLLGLNALASGQQFDLGQFDLQVLDVLRTAAGDLLAVPCQIDPGFIFYNKDLFARAGLPDLPKHVGDAYMGQPWTWDALASVGARLTLDGHGRNATDPRFDAGSTSQWGFASEYWDGQRVTAAFGGGSVLSADGKTVQLSQNWRDAANWYYSSIWADHVAPTRQQIKGALNEGDVIRSGKVAMSAANPWSISLYGGYNADGTPAKPTFSHWDMAVMPAWKGQTSSPTDMEVIALAAGSKHPAEAFRVLTAIASADSLLNLSGGAAASRAKRAAGYSRRSAEVQKVFPDNAVSWSVLDEMAVYAVDPTPTRGTPAANRVTSEVSSFFEKLETTPGLDIDAEIEGLRSRIQKILDEQEIPAQASPAQASPAQASPESS